MSDNLQQKDLRHRTNRRTPKEWVQAWAEKKGVPPGLQPEVHGIPNNVPGVPDFPAVTLEYHWHWEAATDPTGATRQVWFVDGPLAGTATMIPVDKPVWAHLHFPLGPGDYGVDAPYEKYEYRIEQRPDGLWIGRCES